jgi:hypothetical protein
MTNKPRTVAEYFSQFAEKGHIFDEPLEVILECGEPAKIHAIVPRQEYPIKGCAQIKGCEETVITDWIKGCEETVITDWNSIHDIEWTYNGKCSWGGIDINIVAIPSLGIDERVQGKIE